MVPESNSHKVKEAGFFALIAGETKDIRKQKQMSVVLHYCYNGNIYERFVGFYPCHSLNAPLLLNYIKDILACCGINIKNCIAQT